MRTLRRGGGRSARRRGTFRNTSALRLGPHVAARYSAGNGFQLAAAFRRSHQYLQQVDRTGARFGPGLSVGHAWTLAGKDVPAAMGDVWTLGVEWRLRPGWWVDATAWSRQSTGLTLPDPTPGPMTRSPIRWVSGNDRAAGGELLFRRLAGRVGAQLGLSVERSRDSAAGVRFPSSADRTLKMDGLVRWRVSDACSDTGGSCARPHTSRA